MIRGHMETHESAYGNKRTKEKVPKRPTIKSGANMHEFKLKLTQLIARKGLGPASASDNTNIDDFNDKMRDKVSVLCAEMLDDEGPLREEPELHCANSYRGSDHLNTYDFRRP